MIFACVYVRYVPYVGYARRHVCCVLKAMYGHCVCYECYVCVCMCVVYVMCVCYVSMYVVYVSM